MRLARFLLGAARLFAITFCLALSPGFADAAQRIALVIGNGAYSNAPALPNPVNDARLVAETLRRLQFELVGGDIRQNLTQSELKAAISEFTDRIEAGGKDSIALFYYAGHGVQIDGVNYLLPVDVSVRNASDVVLGAVSANDLLRTLELARARVNIIILDACRDNPFRATRGLGRGLARVDAPPGSIVAYATAPGHTAADGAGANSPYAAALANNLGRPGLVIEEVFRRVRVEVNQETNGEQMPWEETSLTHEIRLAEGAAPPPPDLEQRPAVNNTAGDELVAQRAFLKAVAVNTIEAYDDFINRYPRSNKAKEALRVIEMLTDELNWRDALNSDSIGSYRRYLALHKDGSYVEEARAKIEEKTRAVVKRTDEPLAPQSELQRVFQDAPGHDAYGFDYKVIKNTSYKACKSACSEDDECKAITYNKSARWCFFKSNANLLMRNAGADAAIAPEVRGNIRVSDITVHLRTDVTGYDYYSIPRTDFGGCFTACESDANCRAFSFVRKNNSCWLKMAVGRLKVNRNVDSGIK